ncbi:MAG TPA: SIMPL domain-containing protein [Bryobacteraceae bacterium]|nr:SIMPL domain-containing protein [Bryobacteraceae bacterium]
MPTHEPRNLGLPGHMPAEGVTVIGEAVRRVSPESAEFLMEVSNSAPTAAQALRENHLRTSQLLQAVAGMGVQPADLQTISFNVYSLFAPVTQGLPGYGAMPQIGQGNFPGYTGSAPVQAAGHNEIQFGTYHARNVLRVNVREAGRLGEIVDALAKAGATISSSFWFKPCEESQARKAALEAAGRDARAKAEALAAATGRQIGDAIAISEEVVATNGTYAALRASLPYAFGAGAPQFAGELEYYARVSANFRLL